VRDFNSIQRHSHSQLTVIVSLKHFHFLLVIGPTEELTLLDDVLIAFLQSHAAHNTNEAFEMENVVDGPHYELIGADFLGTTETAILHEQSLMAS